MNKDYGYPTTMRYSRTMRQSGTELANSIEHYRRADWSGIWIVIGCAFLMALPWLLLGALK